MANVFQVGDIVELKSGGLGMTVEGSEEIKGSTFLKCVWQDKGKVQRELFLEATLRKPAPPTPFAIA